MSIQVAFRLEKLDSEHAPDRLLLLRDGDIGWSGLDATLTPESAADVIKKFEMQGSEIPVDMHHSTLRVARGQATKAPAVGWIKSLEYVEGEGLYGAVDWLPEAADQIENREYKYHSPVVFFDDESGHPLELHSVALTNTPRTKDQIELLQAAERLEGEANMPEPNKVPRKNRRKKSPATKLVAAEDHEDVNLSAVDPGQALMTKVIMALQDKGAGIADDAPLVDVLKATLEALGAGIDEPEATGDEGNSSDEGNTEAAERNGKTMTAEDAETKAKAAQWDSMNDRLKIVEAERATDKIDDLIDGAIEDGKIMPDDAKLIAASRDLAEVDIDKAAAFIGAMTPMVEPGSVVRGSGSTTKAGAVRKSMIVAASREFDDNPKYTKDSTRKRWINSTLREKGVDLLSDAEITKLENN